MMRRTTLTTTMTTSELESMVDPVTSSTKPPRRICVRACVRAFVDVELSRMLDEHTTTPQPPPPSVCVGVVWLDPISRDWGTLPCPLRVGCVIRSFRRIARPRSILQCAIPFPNFILFFLSTFNFGLVQFTPRGEHRGTRVCVYRHTPSLL